MTETATVVAANGLDDNDPATVGRALAGVEVRIASNRDLQVRAPSVIRGCCSRADDTARVINAKVWPARGEKAPTGDPEPALLGDPLFEPVYVVGEPGNAHLVRDPWTIGNGFMTPTLKLKGNRLMEHDASAIEGQYQKQSSR